MGSSIAALVMALVGCLGGGNPLDQDDESRPKTSGEIEELLQNCRETLPQRNGKWRCVVRIRQPDAIHYGKEVAATPNLPIIAATVVRDPENDVAFYQNLVQTKSTSNESVVMILEERFAAGRTLRFTGSKVEAWLTSDGRLDEESLQRVKNAPPPIAFETATPENGGLASRIGVNPYGPLFGLINTPTGYVDIHEDGIATEFLLREEDDGSVWLLHNSLGLKLLFKQSTLVSWQYKFGAKDDLQLFTVEVQERNDDGTAKTLSIKREHAPDNPLTVELLFEDRDDRDTSFDLYAPRRE